MDWPHLAYAVPLIHVIEEVMGRRGRKRKQLPDDNNEKDDTLN